jgi:manganese efflux pump family protein
MRTTSPRPGWPPPPVRPSSLGLSISLDELAIGFSLGLARLPVAPVIAAIAIQAVVASQLGLALGKVISDRFRQYAERVAGLALIALGGYLIAERAIG